MSSIYKTGGPMRQRCICLLLFAISGILLTQSAPAEDSPKLAALTIKVTDLRNHKGDLIFGVFKSADGFPTEKNKSVNWQVKPANADSVTFTCQLPPGRYSAS